MICLSFFSRLSLYCYKENCAVICPFQVHSTHISGVHKYLDTNCSQQLLISTKLVKRWSPVSERYEVTFRLILTLSLHNLTSPVLDFVQFWHFPLYSIVGWLKLYLYFSAFIITSILTRFPEPLADPPLSVRSLLDFLRTSAIGCF